MSLQITYTIANLQNDAVALSKSVKDALTASTQKERQDAWIDVAINSAKITAGMAELVASNAQWAGWLGTGSTLESVRNSANRIRDTLTTSNDVNAIKAGDVLSVVGGISDIAGNFLIKPGPQLAAGMVLTGCAFPERMGLATSNTAALAARTAGSLSNKSVSRTSRAKFEGWLHER